MPDSILVTAPSRLHFGLMNFGGGTTRQFGGVGLMVDEPGMRVQFTSAEAFAARGPLADRSATFADRWQAYHRLAALPSCAVEVMHAPREHSGLGVGTQLGMAIAAGLSKFIGLPQQTPIELATSVGRGHRSAVGAYGFVLGGLIVERGKLPGEPVSPLDCHLHLPASWRVLLVCARDEVGLASEAEAQAFTTLPPVPETITRDLTRIARDALLPAAARGDFAAFATAVYDYGRLSGECFTPLQGGPYNGQRLADIVGRLRALGAVGVGQSSWGPTIFALLPSDDFAQPLRQALAASPEGKNCDILVTRIARAGARIT